MAVIVEDGTGKSDADSYNSITTFRTYADSRGLQIPSSATDDLIDQALRRAAVWLDTTYQARWPGYKTNRREQLREWPRVGAYDYSIYDNLNDDLDPYTRANNISDFRFSSEIDFVLPDNEVPREILAAHNEATFREVITPGYLNPDYIASTQISRARVEGAVDVAFRGAVGFEATQPLPVIINRILAPLLKPNSGDTLSARTIRG